MDWKIFLSTMVSIFIAELGDKTQFAALSFASSTTNLVSVWLGVVLGLALAGTMGVFAGKLLSTFVNLNVLNIISGVLFILIGVWVLFQTLSR
jgi:putative Ca2+/H+ antiporter (TMEM165/GDT1 family)